VALVIVGISREFFRLMSSIVSFVSWATPAPATGGGLAFAVKIEVIH
jgi:hypothetical protein